MNKYLYICGVDWQHEVGEVLYIEGKMPFYSSVSELKKSKPCWKTCGIVKIKLKLDSWIVEQALIGKDDNNEA